MPEGTSKKDYLPMDNIKRLANWIAHKYHSRDPFEIIQGMNVILVYTHLEGIRGFYQYFQRNDIIYINDGMPDREQRFVCAHEMGHMLLHRKTNAIFMDRHTFLNRNKFEIEANMFAMELLVSDDILEEYREYTTEQLSRLLGYREELLRLRL